MSGHTKWSEINHKNKEYKFKKRRRKDLINAMEITVFSLTNAELDKQLRKSLEEAIEKTLKEHKDSQSIAYTISKE